MTLMTTMSGLLQNLNRKEMPVKINLWAKKGAVTICFGGDPAKGVAPVLTVEVQNPQVLYDEGSNKIQIVETR